MTEQEWRWIFSERLRTKLEEKNMLQRDLAIDLDIGEVAVSHWLNARCSPSIKNLLKTCEILGCGLDELVV